MVQVNTWRDLQGALLAAVQMETTIFEHSVVLDHCRCWFRDFGDVLHDRCGEDQGHWHPEIVGRVRLWCGNDLPRYGGASCAVGDGVGGVAGLLFVANINEIADVLEVVSGQEVFDPTVYYFDQIPTLINPWTVAWVVMEPS